MEGVREIRLIPKEPPPFRGFETRPVPGIKRDEILEKREIELKEILEKTIKHNYHMTLKLEEEIEKEIEIKDERTGEIIKRKELVWEEVEFERILEDKNNYILINPSGMGKTTFLTYIACDLLNRNPNYPFFPLLITCIEINKRGTAASVNDFIQRSLETFYCNSKTAIIDLEWENACFLIDALDQARDVDDIASSLDIQNKYGNYKKAKIIISSRQNTAGKIKEGFNKIRLKLPEDDEIRHYLGEEHYDNLKSLIDSSKELITVPVLLEMLKINAKRGHISSKVYTRTSLYDEFTRILIDLERNKPRYWQDSALVKDFINYGLEESLEKIAFFSLANNEILEIGKDRLINYCESPEKKEALLNTGIILELFEYWEHQLVFRHQSFQAYFAARYIYYQQPEYFNQLTGDIAFFYNDAWYEVLRFYIGLEKYPQKAEEIINSIYQRSYEDEKDDLNRSLRLVFAFFLMSETRVSSEKIDELYEQLCNLLKNNKGYLDFIGSNIDKFNTSNKGQRERINIILELLLCDDDRFNQHTALKVLGKIGSSKAIPLLRPLLSDSDKWIQNAATEAFGKIVTTLDITVLEPLLKDDNKAVRLAVAHILRNIGTSKDIPFLEPLLRDDYDIVRRVATQALIKIGTSKAIPMLESMFWKKNYGIRIEAVKGIKMIGNSKTIPLLELLLKENNLHLPLRIAAKEAFVQIVTAKDIPLLVPLLKDQNAYVRSVAVEALGKIGASKDTPLLKPLLRDQDVYVRKATAKALGKIGTSKDIPLLVRFSRDDDCDVQRAADESLVQIVTSKDIPLLERLLKDDSFYVRLGAVQALAQIVTSKNIPLLEPMLRDENSNVRSAAVGALGKIGTSKNISLLEPLLRDNDTFLRNRAFKALDAINPSKDIPLLESLLRDDNENVRCNALDVLGKIGTSKDIPLLKPMLRDVSSSVRFSATFVLGKIGTSKDSPLLELLLRDESSIVRVIAAESLGKIGTSKDIPFLEPLLRDEDSFVRSAAAESLGKIVTSMDMPLLDLEPLLKNKDREIQIIAVKALGKIGTFEDVPLLKHLTRHENRDVRIALTDALGRIGISKNLPLLESLLGDGDFFVCFSASKAIENIYKRSKPKLQIKEIIHKKEKKKGL